MQAWTWIRRNWAVYAGIGVLLLIVTVLADRDEHVVIWIALFALLVLLLFHEHQLRRARNEPGDQPLGRLIFGGAVVSVAIVGIGLGLTRDWLFLASAGLAVTAAGLIFGELRNLALTTGFWKFGLVLFVAALVAFFAAVAVRSSGSFFAVLIVAVVSGELAAELLSERSHRLVEPPTEGAADRLPLFGSIACAVGLVLLITGFALLVAVGTDPALALGLLIALGIVVVMASVASDSVLVVALIVSMVAIAVQPRDVAHPAVDATPRDERYFAVFGDSYISGEGAEQFIEGTNTERRSADGSAINGCRQATTAWPYVLAGNARLHGGTLPDKVAFFGCSGATTENIATEPRRARPQDRRSGPAELALFQDRDLKTPEFVILSIGGNDASFGEVVTNCIGPGDCTEIGEKFLNDPTRRRVSQPESGPPGIGGPEALRWIRDDLRAAYSRVRAVIPAPVPVVVALYPQPFEEAATCRSSLFSRDERVFINGFARDLDKVVTQEASAQGFFVIDTLHRALVDNGVAFCNDEGRHPGLNLIDANPKGGEIRDRLNPLNWTHNSVHPNEDGHRVLAEVAGAWFRKNRTELERVRSGGRLPTAPSEHRIGEGVTTLTRILNGKVVVQCGSGPDCRLPKHRWVIAESRTLYSRTIGPLALATLGMWLLVLPGTWVARRRAWSLATFTAHLWSRTAWLRTPPWWRRLLALLAIVGVALLVLVGAASWTGLPPGYGAAQSESAEFLAAHSDTWRAWIDGTTRDLALYVPLYVLVGLLIVMATSRWSPKPPSPPDAPSPRWVNRFGFPASWPGNASVRAVLSDGVAVVLLGLVALTDYVETGLFRRTLTRLQDGSSVDSLTAGADLTAVFTTIKFAFAIALVTVVFLRTVLPPVPAAGESADGARGDAPGEQGAHSL